MYNIAIYFAADNRIVGTVILSGFSRAPEARLCRGRKAVVRVSRGRSGSRKMRTLYPDQM